MGMQNFQAPALVGSPGQKRSKTMRYTLITMVGILVLVVAAVSWIMIDSQNAASTRISAPHAYLTSEIEIKRLHPTPTPIPHTSVPLLYYGNSYLKEVALTFDDGPNPTYTPQILSILQRYKVHATFFCIGSQVVNNADLVKEEMAEGHVVGNHTWIHADLTALTSDEIAQQLQKTSDALEKITKVRPTLFRPPYGAFNQAVLSNAKSQHLSTVIWNNASRDWSTPGTQSIINTVENETTNGGIILMHDGGGNRSQTIETLPTIIEWLQGQGYKIVPLQDMMDHMKYVPKGKAAPTPTPDGIVKPKTAGDAAIFPTPVNDMPVNKDGKK